MRSFALPALLAELPRLRLAAWVRWQRWRARLGIFFAGQVSVQLLGFLSGMLLMRWMSVTEYAQYGAAFGFQTLLASFVDLGFGGSIVSLVGARGSDPAVVGGYIAAARWWRRLLMVVVTPVAAAGFYVVTQKQGWPLWNGAALFLLLIAGLYVAGWNAWASAPLLIHQHIGHLYYVSVASAVARLGLLGALHVTQCLDAVTITAVNTGIAAVSAWIYWRAAAPYVREPRQSTPAVRQEMRRYLVPILPSLIFHSVQGQLSTLLISYFGRSQNIAEVTALGRLGQLFTILAALYGTFVSPYFARLPHTLLVSRYLLAIVGTLVLAVLITLGAFLFPQPLLWLLGPQYAHLVHEIGWMVLGCSISFAIVGVWNVHAARKWIFWSGSACHIGFVLVAQVIFLLFIDLSTTMHVLLFGAVSAAAQLLAQIPVAWLGFRMEKRNAAAEPGEGSNSTPDSALAEAPRE